MPLACPQLVTSPEEPAYEEACVVVVLKDAKGTTYYLSDGRILRIEHEFFEGGLGAEDDAQDAYRRPRRAADFALAQVA
jgi:hypothetical protein